MHGAPIQLAGDALLSGYYVNELLLKLMHRHDAQPDIFGAYSRTIEHLAGAPTVAATLRQFEIELLRLLGYALNLEHDGDTHGALIDHRHYEYRAEQGAMPVERQDGPMVFSGADLRAIREQRFADAGILRSANRLLRGVISFHLDGKELNSRKVLRALRNGVGLSAAESEKGTIL
jgi:DNA repair protein RecO (recombination protein O)